MRCSRLVMTASCSGLVRAALHGRQGPQRLDRPVVTLGCAGGLTGQDGAGRGDRVDDVGLAVAAADLPVRPRHLHHLDPSAGQVPGECGPVTSGALDADLVEAAVPAQPREQLPVAGHSRGKRARAQHPTQLIQRGRDVQVLVGVNAARDDDVVGCQSGHGPSFSLASSGAGTARADGRTGQGRACCSRLLLGHFHQRPGQGVSRPADGSHSGQQVRASRYWSQAGRENVAIQHPCRSRRRSLGRRL